MGAMAAIGEKLAHLVRRQERQVAAAAAIGSAAGPYAQRAHVGAVRDALAGIRAVVERLGGVETIARDGICGLANDLRGLGAGVAVGGAQVSHRCLQVRTRPSRGRNHNPCHSPCHNPCHNPCHTTISTVPATTPATALATRP